VFREKTNCVIEVLTTLSIGNFFSFFNNIEISAAVVYFYSIFNKFSQFDVSNKARPILTDFKGYTKCCLAINHQLFQEVTAQIPSNFTLNS
jgi:hypothetical protein